MAVKDKVVEKRYKDLAEFGEQVLASRLKFDDAIRKVAKFSREYSPKETQSKLESEKQLMDSAYKLLNDEFRSSFGLVKGVEKDSYKKFLSNYYDRLEKLNEDARSTAKKMLSEAASASYKNA
ncbi:MAG: hypothetical protein LVQ97_02260 [Candidatus Micrarchaeales archaeon]|nr:hypothetical protein [Candidatus Micrarchaeales archaeon]